MTKPPPLRLVPGDRHWPAELEHLEGAPHELWVRGRPGLLAPRPRVAVVGTRAPTPYGEAQAERFAGALAATGAVVVSGLARGIDQAAHRAALEVGGDTIAVLGSGVDRPWPRGELSEALASRGLLLSEFPPGQAPRRHHFPLRNRLISGLSAAVVVIEAARASGSLITARWAADQGREVFALPGRVDHPMSRGCHRLIAEGARLVECPEEVLAELQLCGGDPIGESPSSELDRAPDSGEPTARSGLLVGLRGETLSADELAQRLGRSTSRVLVELVQFELTGEVARAPGGLWRLLERRR